MPSLKTTRFNQATKKLAKRETLWDLHRDGITFSLLCKFISCRERFRLLVVEGLKGRDEFSSRMEFGNAWHVCEEAYAANKNHEGSLLAYCQELLKRYQMAGEEIEKWYLAIKTMFPIYISHWEKNEDVVNRTPVFQEKVFDVRHPLNDGNSYTRVIRLRGKWDAVDFIKPNKQQRLNGEQEGLYIQENKSKGDINEQQIRRQLPLDLQSMIYLTALEETPLEKFDGKRIGGIRYNVVRRPLSGGKHSITQHKGRGKLKVGAETKEEFYRRLGGLIRDNPASFFLRLKMEVTPDELLLFQRRCLNQILGQLFDWWESIKADPFNPWGSPLHWISPYGTYSTLNEGRVGDLDDYIANGNMSGLTRVDRLFKELG